MNRVPGFLTADFCHSSPNFNIDDIIAKHAKCYRKTCQCMDDQTGNNHFLENLNLTEIILLTEEKMKCNDLSPDVNRCKKGIPVANLYRHYFCERDHDRCPLKSRQRAYPGLRKNRSVTSLSLNGVGS